MKKNEQEILKLNYIISNLESGFLKTRETMVLSSFCFDHRLIDLEPKFQFRSDDSAMGNHYYYDLYYPLVKVIIEVDEDHHQKADSLRHDELKEQHAVNVLGCKFFRIKFHESQRDVFSCIEEAKLELLGRERKGGPNSTKWFMNTFKPEEAIETCTKTIMVSISRHNRFSNLLDLPLQIPKEVHSIPDINVLYLTGSTAKSAVAFICQPGDWTLKDGNTYHRGMINPHNPFLLSGDTF